MGSQRRCPGIPRDFSGDTAGPPVWGDFTPSLFPPEVLPVFMSHSASAQPMPPVGLPSLNPP